jgi:hypothetical protein
VIAASISGHLRQVEIGENRAAIKSGPEDWHVNPPVVGVESA